MSILSQSKAVCKCYKPLLLWFQERSEESEFLVSLPKAFPSAASNVKSMHIFELILLRCELGFYSK